MKNTLHKKWEVESVSPKNKNTTETQIQKTATTIKQHFQPVAPELDPEFKLDGGHLCTVEQITDTTLVFINKKASYTFQIKDIPAPLLQNLKVGDVFPLNEDGTLHDLWDGFFTLYSSIKKPTTSFVNTAWETRDILEGFISHYDNKNNPVLFCNNRFNTIQQGLFNPGATPKIWQQVYFLFSRDKQKPQFTVFTNIFWAYTLITKVWYPEAVTHMNALTKMHAEALTKAKKAKQEINTTEQGETKEILSARQPEGKHSHEDTHKDNHLAKLPQNAFKHLKAHELQTKSQAIANSLAHQARTKNEKIDALTYSHLPEAHMQDLHIGTKVVSKKGTPGIIKKIPSKDNKMDENTVIVSYYWFDDKWGKHREEIKTKIGDFKCVREPEKYIPKRER